MPQRSVFPASAGMILMFATVTDSLKSVPRIRGDDPDRTLRWVKDRRCSPHPQG